MSLQTKAVEEVLRELNKTQKAYVVLLDLLNEQESTVAYEVRYNDRIHMALDYQRWTVNEKNEEDMRKSAYAFLYAILDQLFHGLCEDEILVRRITIMEDGTICN